MNESLGQLTINKILYNLYKKNYIIYIKRII